ncbi:hypothetical protein AQV86_01770 [Nanohaloarchaea archaeon SG9]|nr:hypothetical protein AQV86_01770 [Nanohaloarchaea archaeon SG9]
MKRTVLLMAMVALIGLTSASQHTQGNIETAIVASSANYPDAMVGAAASSQIGAPVLLTEKDSLTSSTETALENLGVEKAIILGGPEVLSENVEAQIDSTVSTSTRLWGVSQTGTSVEISEFFWTESNSATVVQYPQNSEDGYKLLSAVKNNVKNEEEPVLISKPGTVSASVLSEIERLGASEVEVYSTSAVNVTQNLESAGAENIEINEGSLEEVKNEAENQEQERESSKLTVVAAANFRQSLSIPSSANSNKVLVSSEAEISKALEASKSESVTEIKVVGDSELSNQIANRIRNETEKTVEVKTGKAEEITAEQTSNKRPEWSQKQEEKLKSLKNNPGLEKAANKTLTKAESVVDENSSQKSVNLLAEAKTSFEAGDFFEARAKATAAISERTIKQFKGLSREEVRDSYRSETEDFKATAQKLRESGQEMSEQLRNAENQEEKFEAIKKFKSQRESLLGGKDSKDSSRSDRDEDNRKDNGDSSDSENSEGLAAGEVDVEIKGEGSVISSQVTYMASTGGFSVETDSSVEGDKVTFNYDLSSPDGIATQALTEVEESSSQTELESGNYSVEVVVSVDGEETARSSSSVTLEG